MRVSRRAGYRVVDSMHAKSIVDTVFLTKVGEAQAEAGDSVAIFCKRCHSPIGNMTGDPNASASQVTKVGVTCMFCHQVTGLIGVPGNVISSSMEASYVVCS